MDGNSGVKTSVRKSLRLGWVAESMLPMGYGRHLKVFTSKGSRGIATTATAVKLNADGSYSFMMVGDYSKRVCCVPGRATEKAIREEHAAVLKDAEALVNEANAFYSIKVGDEPPWKREGRAPTVGENEAEMAALKALR